MKPKSISQSSSVSAINERHIFKIDKFFRMCAGAESQLSHYDSTSFHLSICIKSSHSDEWVIALIGNIAKSWLHEEELKDCVTCTVALSRSEPPPGILLDAKACGLNSDSDTRRARVSSLFAALKAMGTGIRRPAGRYLVTLHGQQTPTVEMISDPKDAQT